MKKLFSRPRLGILAVLFLVASCSSAVFTVGSVIDELKKSPPVVKDYREAMDLQLNTQDYTKWLQKDYKAIALFEYDEMMDYDSAQHFALKSMAAGQGTILKPDAVSSRKINAGYQEEANSMYNAIQDAYRQNKNTYFPKEMARLQVSYDCWLEQIEENIQPDHIMKCKSIFYDALANMKGIATTVIVYFDNNSFTLTPDEMEKLQAVVSNYRVSRGSIIIEGHTDTLDSAEYNLALSGKRAEIVKSTIQTIDPHIQNISTLAFGETRPAVPTGDGISEPRNRRAIIHFN